MVDRVAHRNRSEPQRDGYGAALVNGRDDEATVARRRVFLLLEGERQSLASGLRRQFHPARRYEDLCLVKMVTRLQRDSLSHPDEPAKGTRPPRRGGARRLEHDVPAWAQPWGPSCVVELESDLNGFDDRLRHARRWLPAGLHTAAEERAAERFANIIAKMEGSLKVAEFTLPSWASQSALATRNGSRGPAPRASRGRPASRRQPRARAARGSEASRAPRPDQSERKAPNGPIDVNEVTYEELRAMKLTITQSRRLLAYRDRVKRFESLDDLDVLPGFPDTVLERLKHGLTV
jgi:DNA uptake protein ComE-like DNA-binding protein